MLIGITVATVVAVFMTLVFAPVRRSLLSRPAMGAFRRIMPRMSASIMV